MTLHLRQQSTSAAVPAGAGILPNLEPKTQAAPAPADIRWQDACLGLALFTQIDAVTGLRICGRHSPARDALLSALASTADAAGIPITRITSAAPLQQFLPSLDLAATLDAGRPVHSAGVLARAAGGMVIVAGAERLSSQAAALLSQALDDRALKLVILDEADGEDDTQLPSALAERLMVTVRTDGIPLAICNATPPADVPPGLSEVAPEMALELQIALAATLQGLERHSPRTLMQCCTVAKGLAQLVGAAEVEADHVHKALQLVLGVSITPPHEQDTAQETDADAAEPAASDSAAAQSDDDAPSLDQGDGEDLTIESEQGAKLDPNILQALAMSLAKPQDRTTSTAAGAGENRRNARRGRPVGYSENPPHTDARPDILATLRAAAPWQKIRTQRANTEQSKRVQIRSSDFRYKKLHQPRETATIFVVDASGSTATQRLGEAKGAIEHLLADCYVRRDNVALVAFRGRQAEVLLGPTRSLVRAKKELSALPGGGATPLASGLNEGMRLALRARRDGQTPLIVVMSDGSANIGLDGEAGRAAAHEDALTAARQLRVHALPTLFIDTGRRPRPQAYEIAAQMGARHITMPPSRSQELHTIVASHLQSS